MFGGYVSHAKKEYIHRYEGMYSLALKNVFLDVKEYIVCRHC